jgi:hypothetical protein
VSGNTTVSVVEHDFVEVANWLKTHAFWAGAGAGIIVEAAIRFFV